MNSQRIYQKYLLSERINKIVCLVSWQPINFGKKDQDNSVSNSLPRARNPNIILSPQCRVKSYSILFDTTSHHVTNKHTRYLLYFTCLYLYFISLIILLYWFYYIILFHCQRLTKCCMKYLSEDQTLV